MRDCVVGLEANHRLEVSDGFSQPVRLRRQETPEVEVRGDRLRITLDRCAVGGRRFRRAIDADEKSAKSFERLPRRRIEPHGHLRMAQRIRLPVGPIEQQTGETQMVHRPVRVEAERFLVLPDGVVRPAGRAPVGEGQIAMGLDRARIDAQHGLEGLDRLVQVRRDASPVPRPGSDARARHPDCARSSRDTGCSTSRYMSALAPGESRECRHDHGGTDHRGPSHFKATGQPACGGDDAKNGERTGSGPRRANTS